MINSNLNIKNFIKADHINKNLKRIFLRRINHVIKEVEKEIKNKNKTLNILNKNFRFNFRISDLKKFKRFKKIAIIGMGGSILGSEAIYNFLESKIKKKVLFLNDLNENQITNLIKKEKLSKILFIIISKSGNTVETISNTLSLKITKKNSKNIIVISEKKNNSLYNLSKKLNLFYIEHKPYIGGRYSVLSEVGIIPAYLMGVDIARLRSKILDSIKKNNKAFLKSNCVSIASIMESKKFNNLIFLNYVPELEKFLYWCQQLIAESLGKKNKGFLPLISNVPKDHHSLLQLYLDGPKDKIFNIFSYKKESNKKIYFNKNLIIDNYLNGKSLSKIKDAQKNALIKAFTKKDIPFREFKIKKINEEVLGKLFSFFIIETVILGKMTNINPFDQPAVEQVKVFTKKFLK